MAVNAAHDWLLARGIVPHFGIMADPKDFVAGYQTPTKGVKYLIASQCHDDVFERFKDHDEVYLWHSLRGHDQATVDMWRDRVMDLVNRYQRDAYCSAEGGSTTGMRGWDIGTMLGFSFTHLVGMDSSGKVGTDGAVSIHGHAKPHVVPATAREFFIVDPANGLEIDKPYRTNNPMAHQANHWRTLLRRRFLQMRAGKYPPVQVTVHGSGLFPDSMSLFGLHHDPNRAAWLRSHGHRPERKPSLPAGLSFPEIVDLPDIR